MNIKRLLGAVLLLGVISVFLALGARSTYAEPSAAPRVVPSYEVTWWTVDGGGAQNLTGGSYSLSGTIGQPDASAPSVGTYSVAGGFWARLGEMVDVFLPLIRR